MRRLDATNAVVTPILTSRFFGVALANEITFNVSLGVNPVLTPPVTGFLLLLNFPVVKLAWRKSKPCFHCKRLGQLVAPPDDVFLLSPLGGLIILDVLPRPGVPPPGVGCGVVIPGVVLAVGCCCGCPGNSPNGGSVNRLPGWA